MIAPTAVFSALGAPSSAGRPVGRAMRGAAPGGAGRHEQRPVSCGRIL